MVKQKQIRNIYDNYLNGNLRECINLINEYGEYEFYSDFRNFLLNLFVNSGNAYMIFSEFVVSIMRVKNR